MYIFTNSEGEVVDKMSAADLAEFYLARLNAEATDDVFTAWVQMGIPVVNPKKRNV